MLPLYFFGRSLEMYFGSKLLLKLYLFGALAGGIMSSKKNYETITGATPAVNAILTYFILSFPYETIYVNF